MRNTTLLEVNCYNATDIFKKMFPDSEIAGRFSCGERKYVYLSSLGSIIKSNALRHAGKEKDKELLVINGQLNPKLKGLNTLYD